MVISLTFSKVLSNLWKVENKIFMRLGRPMILKQKCDKINYSTLLIHGYSY